MIYDIDQQQGDDPTDLLAKPGEHGNLFLHGVDAETHGHGSNHDGQHATVIGEGADQVARDRVQQDHQRIGAVLPLSVARSSPVFRNQPAL